MAQQCIDTPGDDIVPAGGTRACPPGLDDANHFGTSVVPRRAKYYELRNFCIGPFFQGGVTVYRPKNWRGKRLRLKVGTHNPGAEQWLRV